MSSTNKTSLGLNMWEASDKPVRQDFVNDNIIINEKITKLNSDLNPVGTTKVDAGYINVTLAANEWTGVNIPLNKHLSSIDYVQATPYSENPLRIFAPVVTAINTNTIRVLVYNQEPVTATIGLWVLAYGK